MLRLLNFLDSVEALRLLFYAWLGFALSQMINHENWTHLICLFVIMFLMALIKYCDFYELHQKLKQSEEHRLHLISELIRLKNEWQKTVDKDKMIEARKELEELEKARE